MKPKHHFLIHYPTIMKFIGPLNRISCFRNESKNKEGKSFTKVSTNRTNVCRTIAIGHQLKLNSRFITEFEKDDCIISKKHKSDISKLHDYHNYKHSLPQKSHNNFYSPNSVVFLGDTIQQNSVIINFSKSNIYFNIVHALIVDRETGEIFIVSKTLRDCCFEEHYMAYKIYSFDDFEWNVQRLIQDTNYMVTKMNRLPDNQFYINKNWI